MRATLMYAAGDVRVETVPDPKVQAPTDAVVRILLSCVCGSDLWPYKSLAHTDSPRHMGHEFLGVVEETGAEVSAVKPGDVVVAPFVWADNTCDYCRENLQPSCRHGGMWGVDGVDGGQGQYARVPQAQGTLVKLPVAEDSPLPDILDGTIDPGRVFDRTVALEDVAEGYRAMNERESLKVLITP